MLKQKDYNEKQKFITDFKHFNLYTTILEDSKDIYYNISDLSKITSFEAPDMYILEQKFVIGIEHFTFTSYKSSKKGDSIKHKVTENDKNILEQHKKNSMTTFSEYIETNISVENYISNFKKSFIHHYDRINKYKENLKEKNENIMIYFLIQDNTVGGNGIMYNNNYIPYNPTMNKEILEFLMQYPEIDGFIFQCSLVFSNAFYFLKNNIDNLIEKNNIYFDLELFKDNFTREISFYNLGD